MVLAYSPLVNFVVGSAVVGVSFAGLLWWACRGADDDWGAPT